MNEATMYERVGGEGLFTTLVGRFYDGVAADPLLRPLYPSDMSAAREHLRLFLIQYWGGPRTYQDQRGHPRLRMRHAPFVITLAERDAWLRHMRAALAEVDLSAQDRAEMDDYFTMAATQLINAT